MTLVVEYWDKSANGWRPASMGIGALRCEGVDVAREALRSIAAEGLVARAVGPGVEMREYPAARGGYTRRAS